MNFDEWLKEKTEGDGLIGRVVWDSDNEHYQLDVGSMFIGISDDDGNFWSRWENKKIKIIIKEVK